jgi:hypothetical protein
MVVSTGNQSQTMMVSVVRFDSGSFQKYFGDVRTNNMRPMQV